ncbi:MAG TPA: hybrid sensor histidine kinase/response regulator, partial [Polyangia bacterium]|nr:hybrid sensor histidine kinase/response regulator [Polyangia bacterium]
MNNLLTTMIGWAQLARRDDIEPTRRAAALEILERSARRARDIAAGCLDGGRPAESASQRISMDVLAADLLDLHALEFEGAGIEVSTAFEPGLVCAGDPSRLFQVLDNLLRNAIDAMPGGGGLRLSSGSLAGKRLFVAVEDDGPGVDPAFVERMFEPFFTTRSRVAGIRESGSGLGLCICRRIARERGGDVTFSPAPGGGARFTLELPRVAETPAEVAVLDGAARPSILPGVSVLVVDDEEDIREMIRTAFTLRGARVATAADGEAALDACREGE